MTIKEWAAVCDAFNEAKKDRPRGKCQTLSWLVNDFGNIEFHIRESVATLSPDQVKILVHQLATVIGMDLDEALDEKCK